MICIIIIIIIIIIIEGIVINERQTILRTNCAEWRQKAQ